MRTFPPLQTEPPSAVTPPVAAVVLAGLSLLRCFSGTGIPTWVVSSNPADVSFYSRHCRRKQVIANPLTEPERALEDLANLGATFSEKPVLLYGDDPTLLFISRNRERLAEHYRFLLPPSDLVEALVDKTRFAVLAANVGLPVPRTFTSGELGSPDEVVRRLGLPCVFKPNLRVGWFESQAVEQAGGLAHKALRADDAVQLERLYHAIKQFTRQFVIQEYIPGDDAHIYTFHAYCNRDSEILAQYVGRKIRTYPRDSGVSTYLELVEEPELERMAAEILQRLNLVGVLKADFKKDCRTNQFYLLEINARFNLWNYLGAACGINLPYVAYADLTGLDIQPGRTACKSGAKWLSFGNDFRAFIRGYHRDGTLSWYAWLRSYRGKKVYDLFSWTDPFPFLRSMLNYSFLVYRRFAK